MTQQSDRLRKRGLGVTLAILIGGAIAFLADIDGTLSLAERLRGEPESTATPIPSQGPSSGRVTPATDPTIGTTFKLPSATPTQTPTVGPSPKPSPRPSSTPPPSAPAPAPVRIESVQIDFGDNPYAIGPRQYQLRDGRTRVNVQMWWTTHSNYGELSGRNCKVVALTRNARTKTYPRGDSNYRTTTCSLKGWFSVQATAGEYEVSVQVTSASGSTKTGATTFSIVG